MEPFRDDREAAARRIDELEQENRALRQDLFAQKAPPPAVRDKPGMAPGLLIVFIAVPLVLVLLMAVGAAFFLIRTTEPEPPRPVRVGASERPAPEVTAARYCEGA